MPIVLQPSRAYLVTANMVRKFLRDYPEENYLLLLKEQWSDDDIVGAYESCIDRLNAMPPISMYTATSAPPCLRYALTVGTVAILAQGEATKQLRNRATGQDGDVAPTSIFDKASEYLQMADVFKGLFEQDARGVKTQLNMESMYGGFSSGYVTRRVRRRS